MLKENRYQEIVVSKIFKKITNNHNLPQSQQQTQGEEEEIGMILNLPYAEETSEKLWHILRSHKIRSTFYTECTFHKCFCKPTEWVATEDKINIVYKIDCSNSKAVYFGEFKQS